MERHAWEEREARLSIVDHAEVDGGSGAGELREIVPFILIPNAGLFRPGPTSNRNVLISP